MTGKNFFQTDDYYELFALHRAIIEAKFHFDHDDQDVPPSPILARLSERIIDLLILMDGDSGRSELVEAWEKWRNNPKNGKFWEASIDFLTKFDEWQRLGFEQKKKLAKNLLAPFKVNKDDILSFVQEVDSRLK